MRKISTNIKKPKFLKLTLERQSHGDPQSMSALSHCLSYLYYLPAQNRALNRIALAADGGGGGGLGFQNLRVILRHCKRIGRLRNEIVLRNPPFEAPNFGVLSFV